MSHSSSFIHSAYWAPTMTTVDDPALKVIEYSTGHKWTLEFEVHNTIIDVVNLEHPRGTKLHDDVLDLPVYNEDNQYIGTVRHRIADALSLDEQFYATATAADFWDGDGSQSS